MKFGHYFIDRPRFAVVISILIVIIGTLSYSTLPVSQYPEIAPPTIIVNATYPGASPEIIANTVATPIEQEINGIENMLYMTSQSTSDGAMSLTVTFKQGTDLDTAQVQVQNRIAKAEPRLPEEVRRLGIIAQKSSPNLMMVIHLESPDSSFDELYISNYAMLQVRDELARIDGVGDLVVFGAREYSMRIWLNPERMAALQLSASEVIKSLRAQNVQVAGGKLGQPPMPLDSAFQYTITAQGRLKDPDQFNNIIVKRGEDGRLTRLRDVARIEIGGRDYVRNSYLNGKSAIAIGIFQRPGSNALETADQIINTMEKLSGSFPQGLAYRIVYNPTEFIEQSIHKVYLTIFEAILLVVLVIIVFLQSWRAAVIPIVAIPVSLIGTFAVMSFVGYSLNSLSLFGIVLSIGIVVDDAIVVVEDIQRNLEKGMLPRDAARITMTEVGSALISMALVLVAVFIPTAFIGGIPGAFFKQFALTISVATVISAFNSLTLSPALGRILLRAPKHINNGDGETSKPNLFFRAFNYLFSYTRGKYGNVIRILVHRPIIMMCIFMILIASTYLMFQKVPGGFIPHQDQGYLIVVVKLPNGASLERTNKVVEKATEIIQQNPGATNIVSIVGLSAATFTTASNAAAMFILLKPFEERDEGQSSNAIVGQLYGALSTIQDASFYVVDPPPVRGMGRGGGFKMIIQDRSGRGLPVLEAATWELAGAANKNPKLMQVFSTTDSSTPQYFLDIDRTRAEMLNVPVENVFETLQIYLGSLYVNDFNLFGKTYQVIAQADAPHRLEPIDIMRLRAENTDGKMVPLGSIVKIKQVQGPDRLVRYNLYPAAELQGSTAPGISTSEALVEMEKLAGQILPTGISYEWTEIALQEKLGGNIGIIIFPLSVLFVFLLLSAQYESWSLPITIILIVPLCILFALMGVWLRGMDNNILTQIGFIVLIGLASKNAILMVEFARQREDQGKNHIEAVIEAAQIRLRPILMTAFAFILGVVPLMLAQGAGAEMRQVLGTTVFSGMLGVTMVGLFLTPVFYVIVRGIVLRKSSSSSKDNH
ncbi:MAG: hydrophobe/amphiphile efflux-1 family RND transporter [Gammaproteobacteria bacterium]|nr:MAG: hydrophobe/amphiphile efflux-1 family RND transporter [Gammaproteobacteria bacterium]